MGLFDIFSSSQGEGNARNAYAAQSKATDAASKALKQGQRKGVGAIDTATGQAAPLYQNLLNANNAGATAYGNAVGVNGQAGYDQAVNQFHTNPGYQYQMDQGLQALDRNHARAGDYNSGNWGIDALKYSQGLADQSWNTHIGQLAPYLAGQQGATQGLANIYTGAGANKANIYTGTANQLAGQQNIKGQAGSDMWANINNAQQSANMAPWSLLLGLANAGSNIYKNT